MTLKEIGVRLAMEGFHRDGVALGIHRWCVCCFVLCRRSQENEHQTEDLDVQ